MHLHYLSPLYDSLGKLQFCMGPLQDNFLYRVLTHKPDDLHGPMEEVDHVIPCDFHMTQIVMTWPSLTNPMSPGCGLKVILGVEIWVHENDGVGPHQIQSLTPSPGTQEEDKCLLVLWEVLDGKKSLFSSDRPV